MHQDLRNLRVENKQYAALARKFKEQLRDLPSAGKDALDDHHDAYDLKRRIRSLAALDFGLILPNVGIHTGLNQSNILPAVGISPC